MAAASATMMSGWILVTNAVKMYDSTRNFDSYFFCRHGLAGSPAVLTREH